MWGTDMSDKKNGAGASERSASLLIDMTKEARSGETPAAAVDPQVLEKPTRRKFSRSEIKVILEEFEALVRGQQGPYLRQKGLYSSNINTWRRWRDTGKLDGTSPKRGRKARPREVVELEKALEVKERENRQLKKALERAELMLELQKKVNEVLGISQKASEIENNG